MRNFLQKGQKPSRSEIPIKRQAYQRLVALLHCNVSSMKTFFFFHFNSYQRCQKKKKALVLLFTFSLGNVLPRRAQRKKLFRGCCRWQGCTTPRVYRGRYKAQTAMAKETVSRIPAAATAVTRRLDRCIAVISQWNVVRNINDPSLKSNIGPPTSQLPILVEVRQYE